MNYQKPKGEIIKFGNTDILTGSSACEDWLYRGSEKYCIDFQLLRILELCLIQNPRTRYNDNNDNSFFGPNNDPFGGI